MSARIVRQGSVGCEQREPESTELAQQMVEHREFDADGWMHVHAIPEENVAPAGAEERRLSSSA